MHSDLAGTGGAARTASGHKTDPRPCYTVNTRRGVCRTGTATSRWWLSTSCTSTGAKSSVTSRPVARPRRRRHSRRSACRPARRSSPSTGAATNRRTRLPRSWPWTGDTRPCPRTSSRLAKRRHSWFWKGFWSMGGGKRVWLIHSTPPLLLAALWERLGAIIPFFLLFLILFLSKLRRGKFWSNRYSCFSFLHFYDYSCILLLKYFFEFHESLNY